MLFLKKAIPWIGGTALGWIGGALWHSHSSGDQQDATAQAAGRRRIQEAHSAAGAQTLPRAKSWFPAQPAGEIAEDQISAALAVVNRIHRPEDRTAAMRELVERTPITRRGKLLKGILKALDDTDPDHGPGGDSFTLGADLHLIVSLLVEDSPPEMLENFRDEKSGRMHIGRGEALLLGRWARRDVAAARAWCDEHLPDREGDEAVQTIAEAWAESDPEAALTWAAAMDKKRGEEAIENVAPYIARTDPAALARVMIQYPDRFLGGRFGQFFQRWTDRDAPAALSTALGATGEMQQRLVTGVLEAWSEKDWPAASKAAASLPADLHAIRVQSLATHCPQEHIPAQAADLLRLPDQPGRASAIDTLTRRWSKMDAAAASGWVAAMPPDDPSRQAAINGLSDSLRETEPEAAGTWMLQLRDPELRAATLIRHLNDWKKKDAPAALQWAAGAALTDKERAALQSEAGK